MRMLFILLLGIVGCTSQKNSTPSTHPRMVKGSDFVKYQCRGTYLRNNTSFYQMDGNHDIEQWFSFFFSVYNTASWITETNEFELKPKWPFIPDSVQILHDDVQLGLMERYGVYISIDSEKSHIYIDVVDSLGLFDDLSDTIPFPFPQ